MQNKQTKNKQINKTSAIDGGLREQFIIKNYFKQ